MTYLRFFWGKLFRIREFFKFWGACNNIHEILVGHVLHSSQRLLFLLYQFLIASVGFHLVQPFFMKLVSWPKCTSFYVGYLYIPLFCVFPSLFQAGISAYSVNLPTYPRLSSCEGASSQHRSKTILLPTIQL